MIRLLDRVSILNATVTPDPYNTPERDWADAESVLEPAHLSPLSSSENLVNENTVTTRWRVILSPVTAAQSSSRVVWRDLTLEVDGDVEKHTDLRGRVHHCEALLKRVAG